jgi:DNA-directed RNA polymerase subunit RPC12/RpoP
LECEVALQTILSREFTVRIQAERSSGVAPVNRDSLPFVPSTQPCKVGPMILMEFKCQMCDERFRVKVLDREDPEERHQHGAPVRCPKCNSMEVEIVRTVRRAS